VNKPVKAPKKTTKHTMTFREKQQEYDRKLAASLTTPSTEPVVVAPVVNEHVVDEHVVDEVVEEDAPMDQLNNFLDQKKNMKEPDLKKLDKMELDDLISCAHDVFQKRYQGTFFPKANPEQLQVLKQEAQETLDAHRKEMETLDLKILKMKKVEAGHLENLNKLVDDFDKACFEELYASLEECRSKCRSIFQKEDVVVPAELVVPAVVPPVVVVPAVLVVPAVVPPVVADVPTVVADVPTVVADVAPVVADAPAPVAPDATEVVTDEE
jgi:hypothetical protein